ncbi:unnamed protein product [Strongylus vulgaris]|uniref:Uncharacterized protein n=1 Tax=Strongylus vulgaris TaxID=40348 RepID=A0A3P7LWW1_STRVU|nr:unnamed protein product [Strongylus vulgaris]
MPCFYCETFKAFLISKLMLYGNLLTSSLLFRTSPQTVLTYCTSGVLLRMLTQDDAARDISHIILVFYTISLVFYRVVLFNCFSLDIVLSLRVLERNYSAGHFDVGHHGGKFEAVH